MPATGHTHIGFIDSNKGRYSAKGIGAWAHTVLMLHNHSDLEGLGEGGWGLLLWGGLC